MNGRIESTLRVRRSWRVITAAEAIHNRVYTIETIQTEESIKKHLNDLGFVPGKKIVLINDSGNKGVILLHHSRIAIDRTILEQIIIVETQTSEEEWVSLDQLTVGQKAMVVGVHGQGAIKRRLMDMGLTKGVELFVRKVAPLGDPIEINLRGYELTLRKSEAALVLIQKVG